MIDTCPLTPVGEQMLKKIYDGLNRKEGKAGDYSEATIIDNFRKLYDGEIDSLMIKARKKAFAQKEGWG